MAETRKDGGRREANAIQRSRERERETGGYIDGEEVKCERRHSEFSDDPAGGEWADAVVTQVPSSISFIIIFFSF